MLKSTVVLSDALNFELKNLHCLRSDNLLLPKTPSKKRHRKVVQDLSNQENSNPNILPEVPEEEPPPVKRTTRSSRRNNPPQIREEPIKTRNTRGRQKKSEPKADQTKVTFVDESKTVATVVKTPEKSSINSPSTTKTLKRTSSTSPVSIKPVKKKSKSSDESLVDKDDLPVEQTSTPVSKEPPQALLLSAIVVEPEVKPNTNILVNTVDENDETKLLIAKRESLEKVKVVEMDIEINRGNEPKTDMLVEIDNDNNAVEQDHVVLVLDTPPSDKLHSEVHIGPEISILISLDDEKIINEAVPESPVIDDIPGQIVNETVVNETPDKMTNNVVEVSMSSDINSHKADSEHVMDEQFSMNTESTAQPIDRQTTDKCTEEDEQAIEIQPLRRSKRLSKQNANELVSELLPEQTKERLPEEVKEPSSESEEEPPVEATPESKPVRRSTRISKRVSLVSTGYNRRSSRRSSRCSSYFKKPLPLKQIEVQFNSVGINEVVKQESCGKVELGKAVLLNSEHSSTESEDDAPKMSNSVSQTKTPQQRYVANTLHRIKYAVFFSFVLFF